MKLKSTIMTSLLAVGALGTYVYVAGTTGACASCKAITQSFGLRAKPVESNEGEPSCCSFDEEEEATETVVSDKPTSPAPTWALKDINGKTVTSEDLTRHSRNQNLIGAILFDEHQRPDHPRTLKFGRPLPK